MSSSVYSVSIPRVFGRTAVLPVVLQSYLQSCSPAVLPTESYSTYSNGGGLDFPDEERLAIACPTSSANSNLSGVLN